ncbi:MAG: hypothetical protein LBL70_07060 [Treponema sp.]|jgi:hypothetical protein|nr:hypothetical protein [Treponema sp.]
MNHKDKLIILGRAGLKYIDEFEIEYFIDSEMVVSDDYDFAVFSDSIQFYEDYQKWKQPENIIYKETSIEFINEYSSNIPDEKIKEILNRIIELSKEKRIKIKIE